MGCSIGRNPQKIQPVKLRQTQSTTNVMPTNPIKIKRTTSTIHSKVPEPNSWTVDMTTIRNRPPAKLPPLNLRKPPNGTKETKETKEEIEKRVKLAAFKREERLKRIKEKQRIANERRKLALMKKQQQMNISINDEIPIYEEGISNTNSIRTLTNITNLRIDSGYSDNLKEENKDQQTFNIDELCQEGLIN
ncbi:hypothetical protein SNEBB_006619 [Seison nebaliae]|nr:hypothetical protein SNEBB_006619 [Seison nebaliae]